ncbi:MULTISPECIES: GNAT family N-acetyltransferase [Trichocoleus]|uniref:GNAT family N-acetyltransferase n=1 Tax=Trichocoleus desertorum GB2-A4 TaxID=2933944 RepID=A0ABV0J4E7_9CYAN|nr:GNAT family N-acetyltransferase [Trichocoleus sp. FACHB-46]MBD1861998.1 GNAT family N-acetyltransferase [Trichocoleus sp. FACHB-46]
MSDERTSSERLLDSANFSIRVAQLTDLGGLADVLADSFHPRSGLMHWLYPLLRLGIYEDLRNRLRSAVPDYVCLVAVQTSTEQDLSASAPSDALMGTVEMALRPAHLFQFHQTKYLYLSNLAVRSEYRRQGVAHHLLTACESIALSWGFQDIYLHVLENNHQARRLYLKTGYKLQQADPGWSAWLLRQPRRLFLHKRLTPMSAAQLT